MARLPSARIMAQARSNSDSAEGASPTATYSDPRLKCKKGVGGLSSACARSNPTLR